jgi:hypothetical protein
MTNRKTLWATVKQALTPVAPDSKRYWDSTALCAKTGDLRGKIASFLAARNPLDLIRFRAIGRKGPMNRDFVTFEPLISRKM